MRLKPVPIKLDEYKLSHISIEPNSVASEAPGDAGSPRAISYDDIEATFDLLVGPTADGTMLISLAIQTVPPAEGVTPLGMKFTIGVVAQFVLPPDVAEKFSTDESAELQILGSCANILYGVLRDQLNTLSLKMLYGVIVLPMCSFNDLQKIGTEAKTKDSTKMTPGKRKSRAGKV